MWATRIAWTSLAVSVVATLLLSAVPAHAATLTPGAAPPQQWSYSSQAWANRTISHTNGTHPFTYSVQAYYSVHDTITATNTSATTTEMQGLRSVVESYNVTGCAPNCTAPLYYLNDSVRGAASQTQYLNFTTNAKVYENGTAAKALGIANASTSGTQKVADRSTMTFDKLTYSEARNVSSTAHFAVSFSPALGLIPWNLSKNLTWNATSAYTASGGWAGSYNDTASWNGSSTTRSGNFSWTANHTGNQSVCGEYFGALTWHNHTFDWIGLRFHGPFDFDNGLFMTAIGSDLFAGATANWTVWSHPSYGDLSPAIATVYAQHAAPSPSSSSSSGTSGTGGEAGSGNTGGPTGTTGGTPGTTTGTSPTGTQPPSEGTPGQATPPGQGAPTASTPAPVRAHASPMGALWLPFGAVLVVAGVGAAVLVARRGGKGRNPP